MMKGVISTVEGGKQLLTLTKDYYLREAVFAATHKFSGICGIEIFPVDEYAVGVWLTPKKDMTDDELNRIAQDLSEELVDQQIRLDLEKRNGWIRELIVKQAFSPLDNLEAEVAKK